MSKRRAFDVPAAWRSDAACKGATDVMYQRDPDGITTATALCARCPVAEQCIDAAVANGETFGIWGGVVMSPGALAKLRRQRARAAAS